MKNKDKKVKKESKKIYENAFFYQRLVAFIIDVMLVSVLTSIIAVPFTDTKSINTLSDETTTIMEKYLDKKISDKQYINRSISVNYDLAKKSGASTLINLVLLILYFGVYQFYNKGQTIGKKIMHIKTVSDNDEDLTLNALLIRSLIIDFILIKIVTFAFVLMFNKYNYFYGSVSLEIIQYLILFISSLMILFKDNGQGVHDKIAHTRVIKTRVIEEENELCES